MQYRVTRRINFSGGGDGDFTLLDIVGSVKKYIDKTLPFGVERVEYIVVPVRNNDVGPAGNTFALQFGRQGPRLTIASASEGAGVEAGGVENLPQRAHRAQREELE